MGGCMSYRSLAKLFYMDDTSERFQNNERLAEARLMAESTFRTGLFTEHGELFLAVPRELSVLNERILKNERRISAALQSLPQIAAGALIRSLVVNEVVCSNELEGVHSTRRQISELLESTPSVSGTLEQRRFRELARLYLELSDSERIFPETPEDIRLIYDRIMTGEDLGDDAPDGVLFRRDGVSVHGVGGKVVHSGIVPESGIISALSKMLALIASPDIPQTYSAVVSHFLFEYAHPFYDGNGRTGRYLLALYLSRSLSTLTALSVSRAIAENRGPYYRAFREAEAPLNHGELTHFVLTMLGYVSSAQEHVLGDLEARKGQLEITREAISGLSDDYVLGDKEQDVMLILAQYALFGSFPDVPLDAIAEFLGIKNRMTRKHVKRLEEMGLVVAVSRRPLRFALADRARRLLAMPDAGSVDV